MLLGPLLFLAIAGIENRRALAGLLALEGPDRHRWLVPTAAGLAALGLLAAGLPPSRRGLRPIFYSSVLDLPFNQ